MKVVSWNILHGGGRRVSRIISQLRSWRPDIVGLCEFRGTPPSRSIARALDKMGLSHQLSSVDPDSATVDRLLLASRWPLEIRRPSGVLATSGRWIRAAIGRPRPLELVLMWVPNRDEDCTKYVFHDAVVDELRPLAGSAALAMGDTNTGVPGIDEESNYFDTREGSWFERLSDAGWTDIWRQRNLERREYTWHAPNGHVGFRIDQAFATEALTPEIRDVRYDWGEPPCGSLRGPSDHAAIVLDLYDRDADAGSIDTNSGTKS